MGTAQWYSPIGEKTPKEKTPKASFRYLVASSMPEALTTKTP